MDATRTLEKEAVGENGLADADRKFADLGSADGEEEPDALPVLELDAHHMQVRALNYWAGLLEDGVVPLSERLSPESDPDLGPYSIVLDCSAGDEQPRIAHLGEMLAGQCGINRFSLTIDQAPAGSFLRELAEFYGPVLQSGAPRDFKAEHVEQGGAVVDYRGIVLPFSSNGEMIDCVYAVINWEPHEEAWDAADWAPSTALLLDQEAPESDDDPRLTLGERLAEARQFAAVAIKGEERSRRALYQAIGQAYDFSLAAAEAPEGFAGLARDAGIAVQKRAPMTAVAKLVFGCDYDKTRLTEFATALAHAHRVGIERGMFGAFLDHAEGGLKAVIASERRLRREEMGRSLSPAVRRRADLAAKLRGLAPLAITDLPPQGDEFALVLAHRQPDGSVVVLGEVPSDVVLIERAARKLINHLN